MPENWKTYKLKEVAKLSTGFAFKSKFYEPKGNLRVIRGKNVTEGYLRWGDDAKHWNLSLDKLEKYLIKEDDIVIGMDGSKIGKNRALVRKHDLPAILAQRVARVQVKPELASQKLIWQLINNSPFENYVENVKTGTSIPHISLSQVGDFEITLPTLPEQRAIASILSAIDDKIENNLAMNKTLEDMAMALYKHWFVDFGPFQEGKFIDSELGEIPEGWEVKTYSDVTTKITDGAHYSPKTYDEGFPMASVKDMNSWGFNLNTCRVIGEDDYNKLTSQGCQPLKNDVVIAKDGSWLKHAFVIEQDLPLVLLSSIAILRPNGKLNAHLINLNLKLDETKGRMASIVTGAVIQRIVLKDFRKFEVVVPDEESQEKACAEIIPLIEKCWANNHEIQTLTKLRNTLLPKLISGEVRLTEFEEEITVAL